jgi:hypothetical protein
MARKLGKRGPSVRAFVLQTGGVQQHPPCRATRCPSMAEREAISRADAAAFRRAQRPKAAKLVLEPRLRAVVEAKLTLRWSPQQIAGWLPLASP